MKVSEEKISNLKRSCCCWPAASSSFRFNARRCRLFFILRSAATTKRSKKFYKERNRCRERLLPWRSRSIWPKIMMANRWKLNSFSSCEVWSGVEQQGFRVLGFVAGQPRQINAIPIVIIPRVACAAGPSVNLLPNYFPLPEPVFVI